MDPIITVAQGQLVGLNSTTLSGIPYCSFKGVPYAEPPIGNLRFKDPQPLHPWQGLRSAKKEGNICSQIDTLLPNEDYIGDEDCLYLNVYTPSISLNTLFPVMFFIHGGGFFAGSGNSDTYGPDFFIEENVILVTINYRLGILGFLSLGTENVSGNAGLKDMTMALKWIKDNIHNFGGDPNNITIFGESAGGAAVEFLCLSEKSNHLFHKAISQSGSCSNQWAYLRKEIDPLKKAKEVAITLSNKTNITSPDEIIEVLQTAPIEDLVLGALRSRTAEETLRDSSFPFAPIIEKSFSNSFLTKPINELYENESFRKIPYISGYNSKEGILFWTSVSSNPKLLPTLNENFEYFVPYDFDYPFGSNESKQIAAEIKAFYFGEKDLTIDTLDNYFNLTTDIAFLYQIVKSAKMQIDKRNNYFYKLSFDGDLNYFKKFLKISFDGVSHEDDLGYLFKITEPIIETTDNSESDLVRKRMVKMWTNFAKHGDPVPEVDKLLDIKWEKANSSDGLKYLNIGKTLNMEVNPEHERMKFWDELYRRYKK